MSGAHRRHNLRPIHVYRPQTKLREGNSLHASVCSRGGVIIFIILMLLPLPSWMGSIPIHHGNGNGKNGYHWTRRWHSHCGGNSNGKLNSFSCCCHCHHTQSEQTLKACSHCDGNSKLFQIFPYWTHSWRQWQRHQNNVNYAVAVVVWTNLKVDS